MIWEEDFNLDELSIKEWLQIPNWLLIQKQAIRQVASSHLHSQEYCIWL